MLGSATYVASEQSSRLTAQADLLLEYLNDVNKKLDAIKDKMYSTNSIESGSLAGSICGPERSQAKEQLSLEVLIGACMATVRQIGGQVDGILDRL